MLKLCILFLLFILSSVAVSAIEVTTVYTDDHYYVSSGFVDIDFPAETLSALLTDFVHYRNWALKGLDGRDEVSKEFIGILRDVAYLPAEEVFVLYYDINLSWRFGSKGHTVRFILKQERSSEGLIRRLSLKLEEKSSTLKDAGFYMVLTPYGSSARIKATARVKFTWLINLFFRLERYRRNVDWRIERIIENLVDYAMLAERNVS